MKSLQTLRKLITKDSPRLSELIDAKLRESNDPDNLVLHALSEAAADVESDLRLSRSPKQEVTQLVKFRERIATTMAQTELLDQTRKANSSIGIDVEF